MGDLITNEHSMTRLEPILELNSEAYWPTTAHTSERDLDVHASVGWLHRYYLLSNTNSREIGIPVAYSGLPLGGNESDLRVDNVNQSAIVVEDSHLHD